jgi:hypothetical protein
LRRFAFGHAQPAVENEKQVEMLRSDLDVWDRWREQNPEVIPDPSGADLSEANLSRANQSDVLSAVNLSEANLSGAKLNGADLRGANLTGANLRVAILYGCATCESAIDLRGF